MKYIVCEEVCGLLSWMLGHQILSLCYKLMSNYDTVEFFYGELQNIIHDAGIFKYGLRTDTRLLHGVIYQANEYVTSKRLHLICVCIYSIGVLHLFMFASLFIHIDFLLAELCEVLKMFMANSEDVDLLDRAHIYHSLLVSLSNKKVCICTFIVIITWFHTGLFSYLLDLRSQKWWFVKI